jgi:hypothetical protein
MKFAVVGLLPLARQQALVAGLEVLDVTSDGLFCQVASRLAPSLLFALRKGLLSTPAPSIIQILSFHSCFSIPMKMFHQDKQECSS